MDQNWGGDPEFHGPRTRRFCSKKRKKGGMLSALSPFAPYTTLTSARTSTALCTVLSFARRLSPPLPFPLSVSRHTWSTYCVRRRTAGTGSLTYQHVPHAFIIYKIRVLYNIYKCICVYFHKQSRVAFTKRAGFVGKCVRGKPNGGTVTLRQGCDSPYRHTALLEPPSPVGGRRLTGSAALGELCCG